MSNVVSVQFTYYFSYHTVQTFSKSVFRVLVILSVSRKTLVSRLRRSLKEVDLW